MKLDALLDLLREKGVRVFTGPVAGFPGDVHLELGDPFVLPPPTGAPVNLDEGMPDLARDPDAPDDEDADPIVTKNFRRSQPTPTAAPKD